MFQFDQQASCGSSLYRLVSLLVAELSLNKHFTFNSNWTYFALISIPPTLESSDFLKQWSNTTKFHEVHQQSI